jgi:hypothetical protein
MKDDRHGNRIERYKPDAPIDIRKVPADSVPYGESISRNGRTVWVAYDGDRLVCIGATAGEARSKYKLLKAKEIGAP